MFDNLADSTAKVAVLGMGNELLRDEGIGVHVIRRLEQISGLDDVRLIDGGTSPDAIDLIGNAQKLIIVDAAHMHDEPGAVYRLTPQQVSARKPSTVHEFSVIEMLWMMDLLSQIPEVIIIGIEPKEIDWGLELSPELERKLPEIVGVVLDEIANNHTPEDCPS